MKNVGSNLEIFFENHYQNHIQKFLSMIHLKEPPKKLERSTA